MKLLAFDTAASACSVALMDGNQVIASRFEEMARGHASALIPMVQEVMEESQTSFEDVDGYGVTIGPGAFTGLRIALSSARAFGLAHKKPVIGVTTMEALALQASLNNDQGYIIVSALDAKRADIYAQSFGPNGDQLRQAPIASLPEDLAQKLDCQGQSILIAGDCFDRISEPFVKEGCKVHQCPVQFPDAKYVGQIALNRLKMDEFSVPRPLYIRPPDAALPKNGGRLRP